MIGPSSKLGPYEIVSALGAGGMGEVWRAKDTRLDRHVAIKILPSHLADSGALRERFDREARLISSLNHPNICSLFDVGHQDGTDYLVMEYLEGETLADRLRKGPLPLSEVLRLGTEIAEALATAHRQGIVHRDLKPGNVMLSRSGAKLLDFGLAKLSVTSSQAPIIGLTNLPTEQKALTQEGTILGTFQYMAPEQLEGLDADARTDIFALGTVLYEMVTGRRAFEGKTKTSLIAAIVDRDPAPVASLQPATPPALEHVIRKCLAKDPEDRWQSAADIAGELRWIAEGTQTVPPAARRMQRRERGVWMALTLVLLLGSASLIFLLKNGERTAPVITSSILPPPGTRFILRGASVGSLVLSPDGQQVLFTAAAEGGDWQIWIRPLVSATARPLAGTEGAMFPFWSPDGRFVAFFARGKLMKIDVNGGIPVTICDASDGRGGSWSAGGTIIFAPDTQSPLHTVPADGGASSPITKIDTSIFETTHRFPHFLPDGRHVLYVAASHAVGTKEPVNAIWLLDLEGGSSKRLVQAASAPVYSRGHLLYMRNGAIFAQPLDAGSLEISGSSFTVAEDVQYMSSYFTGTFTATRDGLLAYKPGSTVDVRLALYARNGTELGTIGEPGQFAYARVSPDGRKLAVAVVDPSTEATDIWTRDLEEGTATRLTFEPSADDSPVWSPDGTRIAFRSARSGNGDIYVRPAAGGGRDELLFGSDDIDEPHDWSPDGKYLTFNRGRGRGDLWVLPLFGDRKPFPLVQTTGDDGWGRVSPDGRWIAYISNESGRWQMFATRFPGGEGKWQLAADADWLVGWRNDGREIYLISTTGMLQALAVEPGEDLKVGALTPLFPIDSPYTWASFGDGERFVASRSDEAAQDPPVTLVTDWLAVKK